MSSKTAKLIFYLGTLSSAILFLILTWDTHRQIETLTNADKLSAEVVSGKKVFQKYNCNDCHTILGFGGYYAPDLTKVYRRRGGEYIRQVLQQPEVVLAASFRKMPQQNLSAEEVEKLVAFFEWVDDIDNLNWPPQDSKPRSSSSLRRLVGGSNVSPGAALFKENNCFDCHQIGGVGGTAGPALDTIGNKSTDEQIRAYISDPLVVNPYAQMPSFKSLPEADLRAISEFLSHQQGEAQ